MIFFKRAPRLQWPASLLIATLCAVTLSACGGDEIPVPPPRSIPQQSAEDAVRDGLVGAVFWHLTATQAEEGVAGIRKAGTADAVQRNDAFLIGSTTKAMTSAIAGRLVERGTIGWTTTLAEALPDLAPGMLDAYRGVTLEHLLAHRGGLPAFTDEADTERFREFILAHADELPTTLAGRKRFFATWILAQASPEGVVPMRDFRYSNAGYALAAMMLEARSGFTYRQLFEQELAQPLGMPVRWPAADEAAVDRPSGHAGTKEQLVVVEPASADVAQWLEVMRPAGSYLAITPQSYAAWVRWHLLALQGRSTPLPADYVQRLRELEAGDYALGWGVRSIDGRPVLAHNGADSGFNSEVLIDIAGRSGSFGFTNTAGGDGWVPALLHDTLLEIERKRPPAP